MKTSNLLSHLARLRAAIRGAGCLMLLLLGTGFVAQASAGCLQYEGPLKPSLWQQPSPGAAGLMKVDFRTVSDEGGWPDHFGAPIVGLWHFTYFSKGNANKPAPITIPDGAPVDGGNTTWFADGNELTYSGMRDPTTGAVCLGVWKQTGERTYVLNHIGLSWNPPGNAAGAPVGPGGPAFIKQFVTLARDGNSYTGSFTITQLGPDGKTLALPGVITGTIEATRVTLNTTTEEP
jgi:hypothetical protein